jgi:polyhydroxybutyrate depolymerase
MLLAEGRPMSCHERSRKTIQYLTFVVGLVPIVVVLALTNWVSPEVTAEAQLREYKELGEGEYTRHLTVGGHERSYILSIPQGIIRRKPAPVILGFHGGGSTPRQFARITELSEKAGNAGFIVVYPAGFRRSWNAGDCCPPAQTQGVDAVKFVKALLDDLAAVVNFDVQRVFATGWSNGGKMVYRLACELSDRFAAIVVVDSGLGITDCRPTRPIPILHFHGTADTFHPYFGGPGIIPGLDELGAPKTIRHWVQLNQCTNETDVTYKNGNATCVTHTNCKEGAVVTLCTIVGMGHQWPGHTVRFPRSLGPGTDDISATDTLVSFFQTHPMITDR